MKATAKRRRSKKQIKLDKDREEWERLETARKIQRLEQLEKEHRELQQENVDNKVKIEHVQKLIDTGVIDLDDEGFPIMNADRVLG